MPLHDLQEDLRRRWDRERIRTRTDAIRILAGNDLLTTFQPCRGLDQDVLLRVRVEPLSAGAGRSRSSRAFG